MKSLREIVESSPGMRAVAMRSLRLEDKAEALAANRWDWQSIQRVLVVRLRSIGDTVLTTPSLVALRRFLPEAQIDILLETGSRQCSKVFHINNVIAIERRSTRRGLEWRGRYGRRL